MPPSLTFEKKRFFFSQILHSSDEGEKVTAASSSNFGLVWREMADGEEQTNHSFHTDLPLNTSLYVLGFKVEFVKLSGGQKIQTSLELSTV